jgi:ankyrin repeat protein
MKWVNFLADERRTMDSYISDGSHASTDRFHAMFSDPPNAIFAACVWGLPEILDSLPVEDLDPSGTNLGRTPVLCVAIEYGHPSILEKTWLLTSLAQNLDCTGDYDRAPLHYAATYGRLTVAKILSAHGAAINAKEVLGRTPLALAAWGSHEKIVEHLLTYDSVDVDSQDSAPQTPIFYAIDYDSRAIVEMLLKKGASTTHKGARGRTPLCCAAEQGRWPIMRVLLEQDQVDIDCQDC